MTTTASNAAARYADADGLLLMPPRLAGRWFSSRSRACATAYPSA